MAGRIAGVGESTGETPPAMARFVTIALKADCGAEDAKVFKHDEQLKTSDAVSVEGGAERLACVSIQVGCSSDDLESEGYKICRICHLSPELAESAAEGWDQIQIGCGCKGDLGFAHSRCAEAWFRVKRNRICEICGLTAKNIVGEEDSSFMKLWNEGTSLDANNNPNLQVRASYLISKSFCNFFLSLLVLAIVLPWFFRAKFF
ncbi:uncharacterized protein LOC110018247 [Phalaenopsis equestris]|uniref:uncharacterized protein LOC110018247 n=1 Tax=Phalaenopsis equestris TaxID=78828 RepID=UPI0009E560D4|nr:uncharacterized protein LOC110018247 [Phalaenopsis equestris]